jgi:hypothetical protein
MSEIQKQSETATWCEKILNALESADSARGGTISLETEPAWVVAVLMKLVQQVMPGYSLSPPRTYPASSRSFAWTARSQLGRSGQGIGNGPNAGQTRAK